MAEASMGLHNSNSRLVYLCPRVHDNSQTTHISASVHTAARTPELARLVPQHHDLDIRLAACTHEQTYSAPAERVETLAARQAVCLQAT